MKVLVLFDNSGPKYHRVLLPAFLMPGIELVVNRVLLEDQVKDCDILFFNRVISNVNLITLCKWREKYGFKMIVDFDDHWRLGPDHYLFQTYQNHQASEVMEKFIEVSDGVFVTHERLYNEVLHLNKECHILPNAIPRWDQFLTKKIPDEKTRLFWAGGVTHKRDIQLLSGPVRRINRPGVKWVMGGFVRNNPEWQSMASYYTNGGRFENDLLEALPVDSYYYAYSKCDISLVPLHQTTFNSHKSNLKVLEAANVGAPVIVSKVDPYLNLPYVNYVERQSDWFTHADRLLKNPNEAKEQGERLKEYCFTEYNFDSINKQRRQIFDHICEKKTGPNLKAYNMSLLTSQVRAAR